MNTAQSKEHANPPITVFQVNPTHQQKLQAVLLSSGHYSNPDHFQREYFMLKDDNMRMHFELKELTEMRERLEREVGDLRERVQSSDADRMLLKHFNEGLERECSELKGTLKREELRNAEISLSNKGLTSDLDKANREVSSLSEQLKRLHDPVVVRFERDALVETHKQRIKHLEQTVASL